MSEWWWRVRYAYWIWRWTRCTLDFAWASAKAAEPDFEPEDTPKEAADSELSCWDDDGD